MFSLFCILIFVTNYSFCFRVSSLNDLSVGYSHKTRRHAEGFDWNEDSLPEVSSRRKSSNGRRLWNTPDSLRHRLIFEDGEDDSEDEPTTTVAVPGMETPRTPCEDRCLTTPEYNPVCGDDKLTYFSRQRLQCAIKCGKSVRMKHFGACSNLQSNNNK